MLGSVLAARPFLWQFVPMLVKLCQIVCLSCLLCHAVTAETPTLNALFNERIKSVAAVECFIQSEEDRSNLTLFGVVMDDQGHVVLLDSGIPGWLPPERFRDFRVFQLGILSDGFPATYLGQDHLTGNHYLKMAPEAMAHFVPITAYPTAALHPGDFVWGIAANDRDWDFLPYLLSGYNSTTVPMPQQVAFADSEVGRPGSIAFNRDGAFVGWIQNSFNEGVRLTMDGRQRTVQLRNMNESPVILTAEAFLREVNRIPESPVGEPRAWLGVANTQALDSEVAEFLELQGQGAVVLSDVIVGSPADTAGIQSKDIVVAVAGQNVPRFAPRGVVVRWFDREIHKRAPGDPFPLTINRDGEIMEFDVVLGEGPVPLKEAEREYYPRIGFSIRQFVLFDAIRRRILDYEENGVIADFVNPNKPASSAGLKPGDWIKEIDGQTVANFTEAADRLTAIEADTTLTEMIVLIERNNETQVLRIKLQ